jgi:hypothetical protein
MVNTFPCFREANAQTRSGRSPGFPNFCGLLVLYFKDNGKEDVQKCTPYIMELGSQ